jgi:hypothetical protein
MPQLLVIIFCLSSLINFLGANYQGHFLNFHGGKTVNAEEVALIGHLVEAATASPYLRMRNSTFTAIPGIRTFEGFRCAGCNAGATRLSNINHYIGCLNLSPVTSKLQSISPAGNFGVDESSGVGPISYLARCQWNLVQESMHSSERRLVTNDQFYAGEGWYTDASYLLYSRELIKSINDSISDERVRLFASFFKSTIALVGTSSRDLRDLIKDAKGYSIRIIADGNDAYSLLFGRLFAFLECLVDNGESKALLAQDEVDALLKLKLCTDPASQYALYIEDAWRVSATRAFLHNNREDLIKLFVRFQASPQFEGNRPELVMPSVIEQMAGKLLYFCRLYFLYAMTHYSDIAEIDKQFQLRAHLRIFNDDNDTPLARMTSLKGKAGKFAFNDLTRARLTTFGDPASVLLDNDSFSINDLQILLTILIKKFDEALEFLLLDLDHEKIQFSFKDSLAIDTDLFGFAEGNEAHSCALLSHILINPALKQRYIAMIDNGYISYNAQAYYLYSEKLQSALELLSSIIHIAAGMPGRSTEVCGLKLYNSAGKRNVFYLNDQIALFYTYGKTNSIKDSNSGVFRFLPNLLTRRFVLLVALIRPFHAILKTEFARSNLEIEAATVYLFWDRSGHFSAERYRKIFTGHVEQFLGKSVNFSGWRQLMKYFSQQFFDSSLNSRTIGVIFNESVEESPDLVQDLQAGHSTMTSRRSYGRSQNQTYDRAVDIRDFWLVSNAWHKLLQVEEDLDLGAARQHQFLAAMNAGVPFEEDSSGPKRIRPSPVKRQITLAQSAELFQTYLPKSGFTNYLSAEQRLGCELAVFTAADLIVVLPTGGGKSLIFTLYALKHGFALLIVPTKALQDQFCIKFQALNLRTSKSINDECREANFVILTPDQAVTPAGMSQICEFSRTRLRRVFIDEAHCVYLDADYRDSFKKLIFLTSLGVALTFLSATLSIETESSICAQFTRSFTDQFVQVRLASNCKNLLLRTFSNCDRDFLVSLLQSFFVECGNQERGIIYVSTRNAAISLGNYLNTVRFKIGGSEVFKTNLFEIFLGSMEERERLEKNRKWREGACPVMIATNAFGLGIDYGAVRLVINYGLPYSLDDYVQRIGRAGRDGFLSRAFLLLPIGDANHAAAELMREFAANNSECMRRFLSNYMDKTSFDCSSSGSVLCGNCQGFKDAIGRLILPPCIESTRNASAPIIQERQVAIVPAASVQAPFTPSPSPSPAQVFQQIPFSASGMVEKLKLFQGICMLCAYISKQRRHHLEGCTEHKGVCVRCFGNHRLQDCFKSWPPVSIPGKFVHYCCYVGGSVYGHQAACNYGDVLKSFLAYTKLRHLADAPARFAAVREELLIWKNGICQMWVDFFNYASKPENLPKEPLSQ